MALSDSQKTRYDVDVIDETTLTKTIDNYPNIDSPLMVNLNDYYSSATNVWYVNDDGDLETNSFIKSDTLLFHPDCDELAMKSIQSINISCRLVSNMIFTIKQVGIVGEIGTFTNVEKTINKTGDMDVSIDISSISNEDLIYLIEAKKFKVFMELNSDFDIGSIKISECILSFDFSNILQDEIDAVKNRLNTYTKDEIDEKMDDITHGGIDITKYDVGFTYQFGLGGEDGTISIHTFLEKVNNGG